MVWLCACGDVWLCACGDVWLCACGDGVVMCMW